MLGIIPGKDGWHTYYFRRHAHGAPLPRLAEAIGAGLSYVFARGTSLLGKPWRRVGALLKPRG